MSTHAELSASLAAAYRDRAAVKMADIRNRAARFWQLNDGSRNVTQIRTEVDMSATDLTVELIEADGEIDALKVELHALEFAAQAAT